MTEKYFFSEIEKFFQLQDKQRQRGLNNYNVLTAVLKPSDEVHMHSGMLYSLLNPDGKHFQGSLFLSLFLDVIRLDGFEMNINDCVVRKEYKNIDLYVTDGCKHIIIENKIHAGDQEKQIERYLEIIKQEDLETAPKNIAVVYLSLDRKVPSQYSLGALKIKGKHIVDVSGNEVSHFLSIHYKTEIMDWLKQCLYEVQNITNLNHAIEQYMDVIRMINNEYKGKAMTLADFLTKNKELYPMAVEVCKALPQVREAIAEKFLNNAVEELQQRLGGNWVVEIKDDRLLSTKWGVPISIYKQAWDRPKKLVVGFEFARNDFHGCYLGVVRNNNEVQIKGGIDINFNERLGELDKKLRTTPNWLHWEWFQRGDFIEYIHKSEDNAKNELIGKFEEMVEVFETNSNLLSEINATL